MYEISKQSYKKTSSWSIEDVRVEKHNSTLPSGIVRSILLQITKHHSNFCILENTTSIRDVQGTINKLSTSNVKLIKDKIISFCKDKYTIIKTISVLLTNAAKQPLFTNEFVDILNTLVKIKPDYFYLLSHILKTRILNIYITKELFLESTVNSSNYLEYCRINSIKKKCIGFFNIISNISNVSTLIDKQYINNCMHTIIENIYENENYVSLVESIITLMNNIAFIDYIDDLYLLTQTTDVLDIRSRFLILNAIDYNQNKSNCKKLKTPQDI